MRSRGLHKASPGHIGIRLMVFLIPPVRMATFLANEPRDPCSEGDDSGLYIGIRARTRSYLSPWLFGMCIDDNASQANADINELACAMRGGLTG